MTHERIEHDDVVERYVLRRLPESEECEFEEHYLGCKECWERIREEEELTSQIRQACSGWSRRGSRRRFWSLPAPALGLAAALAAAAVYLSVMTPTVIQRPKTPVPESAALQLPVVDLRTYRAGATETRVKAGAAYRLRMDLRGVEAGPECSVEVVRESGESVWRRSGVAHAGERAEVDLQDGLAAGAYWVRVFSQGKLVREFGLQADP